MLGYGWNDSLHLLRQAYLSKVVELTALYSERLSNDHSAFIMRIEHFFIFFTCEEADFDGVVDDSISIRFEGAPNDLHVAVEKSFIEISASTQVNQVQYVLFLVIEVVGGIGVRLHHLELEQFLEAKLQQKRSNSVPLRFVAILAHESVDFTAIDEFSAQNGPRAQVVDYFGAIEVLWVCQKMLPVRTLVGRFSLVVAFPMELTSRNINSFIKIETSWKNP